MDTQISTFNNKTKLRGKHYQCATQVIGFGAAGLGVALAADKLSCLETMLHKGLVYIDKRAENAWESLRYDIHSNSKASDFMDGIRKNGIFQSAFECDQAISIRSYRKEVLPLNKISDFFTVLSQQIVQKISQYELSGFISETPIRYVQIDDDQKITSFDQAGDPLVTSRFAIASVGGIEVISGQVKQLAEQLGTTYTCSEKILRKQFDTQLYDLIVQHKKIVVVGGGHSAFSSVEYLLRQFGDQLGHGQIIVLVRDKVNVYYDSIEDYMCSPRLCINPKFDACTNEVNRYCGLRGNAKRVYINMMADKEPRVQLQKMNNFDVQNYSGTVGICIQAIGYTANKIDVVDSHGNSIEMATYNSNYALSRAFNFVSTSGTEYKSLFGLGLGCFAYESEHFKKTGEIPVGVNIYHASDAINIVENLSVLLKDEIAA